MEIKDLRMVDDFFVVDALVTPVILGIKFLIDPRLFVRTSRNQSQWNSKCNDEKQ